MKVFLAGTSFLPAYGGPAFSVSRLGTALAEAGVEVGMWAPDASATRTPLLPDNSSILCLAGTAPEALEFFGSPELIHDNGIWLAHNHRLAGLANRGGIPRVVSTRGMLEPWAMNHKRLKKRAAWALYQRRDLNRAAALHTTAESEAINVRRRRLRAPVHMIPNGVDLPDLPPQCDPRSDMRSGQGNAKTALFLGRIYPVKGLPMLVEAWARVRPPGWRLVIAGPDEDGHLADLEAAVAAAGLAESISFPGPLDGLEKSAAFLDARLFVLPTHTENFGMAVGEALAHGVPVLTTKGAPWSMLPERGCGWWVEPTVDGIAEGLHQATSLDIAVLMRMGAAGRELIAAEFGRTRLVGEFVAMYECVIAAHRLQSGHTAESS